MPRSPRATPYHYLEWFEYSSSPPFGSTASAAEGLVGTRLSGSLRLQPETELPNSERLALRDLLIHALELGAIPLKREVRNRPGNHSKVPHNSAHVQKRHLTRSFGAGPWHETRVFELVLSQSQAPGHLRGYQGGQVEEAPPVRFPAFRQLLRHKPTAGCEDSGHLLSHESLVPVHNQMKGSGQEG